MANWTELKQFLYNTYTINEDSGDYLTMLFNVGNGRSQYIAVHNNGELVTFSAAIARVGDVRPEDVLKSGIPFGVAQAADYYVLVHSSWAATLDELEVTAPINALVLHADAIEKRLTGKDEF